MKLVHASFWFAAISSSFMGFALMVPIWLGRKLDEGLTELHGAFYTFQCQGGKCEVFARVLSSSSVPLIGRDWDIEIAVMPALALIAFLLCFVAVTILEAISCRCCGDRLRTRRVIIIVNLLLIASAFFSALTVFIAIYVCSEYYKDDKIDHAVEFPWSVLLFAIALVLIIFAIIFFTYILLNWEDYKLQYGHYGTLDDDYVDSGKYTRHDAGSHYSRSRGGPRSLASANHRWESASYANSGLHKESSFTNLSDFGGKAKSESGYFNYPSGVAKSVDGGGSVLGRSGRSIVDSPRLNRGDRRRDRRTISLISGSDGVEDFIERSSERSGSPSRMYKKSKGIDLHRSKPDRLRMPPVPWEDEIEPDMLRSGNTRYRESMIDEMMTGRP